MAHQAYYTSAHSCTLPSEIDKNRVNALGCHLYLQKPYILFLDSPLLSLGLFSCGLFLSHPPSFPPSLSFLVSQFSLSWFTHASIICPFPLSFHTTVRVSPPSLRNGGCCTLCSEAHYKAHCFVPALPAINLFCLTFLCLKFFLFTEDGKGIERKR